MKRIRVKEIHETTWCPEFFRDCLTEFLIVLWAMGFYDKAIEKVCKRVRYLKSEKLIDLCSGAGDYVPRMLKVIRSKDPQSRITVYKTDLYPNKSFFETEDEQVKYWQQPLDAAWAFVCFDGFFCMFSALHHFDEKELLRIFFNAARNGKSFAFYDISQRRLLTDILPNIFLPGIVWITIPFLKKFTWKHLCFVYLLPIVPVIVCIDGFLSRMRAYELDELQALADRVNKRYPEYCIRVSGYRLMGGVQKVTEVTGFPLKYSEQTEDADAKDF